MSLVQAIFISNLVMASRSATMKPGQKVVLTIESVGVPAQKGRVQHLLHPVPGFDAAAVLVQYGEEVFVEQEDLVGLLVDMVHHHALKDRHTEVWVLTCRSLKVRPGVTSPSCSHPLHQKELLYE